tara:strand:- start:46 stop:246 length:201 start_codon:yes stop_codon:yes gene_type:complete
MNLERYIVLNGLNYSKFADKLGLVDARSIARYAGSERIPNRQVMSAIYALTEGVVTPNDFYELPHL